MHEDSRPAGIPEVVRQSIVMAEKAASPGAAGRKVQGNTSHRSAFSSPGRPPGSPVKPAQPIAGRPHVDPHPPCPTQDADAPWHAPDLSPSSDCTAGGCRTAAGKPERDRGHTAAAEDACRVDVHMALRALVPVVTAQSAAIAIRMLDRMQQFQQYAGHWSARPKVPPARSMLSPACCL